MSKSRRVLSLVLCLLMLLSAVPLFPVESEAATTYLWPVVNGTANSHGFKCSCSTHKGTHGGQDIGGSPYGQAILSPCDGTVTVVKSGCRGRSFPSQGKGCTKDTCNPSHGFTYNKSKKKYYCNGWSGNGVTVKDDSTGYSFSLAHMAWDPIVKKGQKVHKGQVIGYVGESGYSYGVHLHLTVKNNKDKAINPMSVPYDYPKSAPAQHGLLITGVRYPVNKKKGDAFTVSGLVSSDRKITSVSIKIVDKNGKETDFGSAAPNTYSYDLNSLNGKAQFKSMKTAGTYTYRFTAKDEDNNVTVFEREFTVSDKATTAAFKKAEIDAPEVETAAENGKVKVTLTCPEAKTIYYTTDGKAPTEKSAVYNAKTGILLTEGTNVKILAVNGKAKSDILTKSVSIPYASAPKIKTAVTAEGVRVEIETNGQIVHYTLDGSAPTLLHGKNYTGAFVVTSACTVRAVAFAQGKRPSVEETAVIDPDALAKPAPAFVNTGRTFGLGDQITLRWEKVGFAAGYRVTVAVNGELSFQKDVSDGIFSFVPTVPGDYVIGVQSLRFDGNLSDPATLTCRVMPDVTVRFVDFDGTLLSRQTVHYGCSAVEPARPNREGHTCQGWDRPFTNLKEDTVITAVYTANDCSLVFRDENENVLARLTAPYGSSVTPPEAPAKEGYEFLGWHVVSGEGTSYEKVDGSAVFKPLYRYIDLAHPVALFLYSASRNESATGYNVRFAVQNYGGIAYQARLVAVIKTGNDKVAAAATKDVSVPADSQRYSYSFSISGTAEGSRCEIYLVNTDSDTHQNTGGALSYKVTGDVVRSSSAGWSAWSGWSETPVSASDTVEVETKTQYSYRDKVNGTPTVTYGAWSGWGTTKKTASSTLDVQTATIYRYYAKLCPNCNNRQPYWSTACTKCGKKITVDSKTYFWTNTAYSKSSSTKYDSVKRQTTALPGQSGVKWFFSSGNLNHTAVGTKDAAGTAVVIQTGYRSRSITTTYNYTWSDWSTWYDTAITSSDSREVRTRTLYRSREKLETAEIIEDLSGTTYRVQGRLESTEDLKGKDATVFVYKNRNTDPTAAQIEYITQITLGENNAYDFSFIPREEISEQTGDYVVAFGVAGGGRLFNAVDVIEAPKPLCKVTFYGLEDEILATVNVPYGEDAAEPALPEKPGYDVRWNKTPTFITADTTIRAVAEPAAFDLVFVDYENREVLSIARVRTGEPVPYPSDPSAEGKTFVGWDLDEDAVLTGTTVVAALYEDVLCAVDFLNDDGSVFATVRAPYGSFAEPPETAPEAEGKSFLSWDSATPWWNLKMDVSVRPVFVYAETSEAPVITVPENDLLLTDVELTVSTEGAVIRYTLDGSEPTESSPLYTGVLWFDETGLTEPVDLPYCPEDNDEPLPEEGNGAAAPAMSAPAVPAKVKIAPDGSITLRAKSFAEGRNPSPEATVTVRPLAEKDLPRVTLSGPDTDGSYTLTLENPADLPLTSCEAVLLDGRDEEVYTIPIQVPGNAFSGWSFRLELPNRVDPFSVSVSAFFPFGEVYTGETSLAPAVKIGDVDSDGSITAADARLALRRAVELETFAPGTDAYLACDADRDDGVTAADARMILRAAVELEDPEEW